MVERFMAEMVLKCLQAKGNRCYGRERRDCTFLPPHCQGGRIDPSPPSVMAAMQAEGQTCWALVGPTASGKSAVALELGRAHDVEIVSVDSMQVYRGMDVGTAKPTERERAAVPHHMIDVLDPEERCNVAKFCRMAMACIRDIQDRGCRPLIVGGSAMYLKGLLWGFMEAPARDPELRRRLREEYETLGGEVLHDRLARIDPEAADRIHPNDVQRLVRALEVCRLTGEPISRGQYQFEGEPRLDHVMVGLRWPRSDLYGRINRRVDGMMERGLPDEVRNIRPRLGPQSSQAVGYKELTDFLDGAIDRDEAVRLIKRNTRRYAKHQMTWFRHFPRLRWLDVNPSDIPAGAAARSAALFNSHA